MARYSHDAKVSVNYVEDASGDRLFQMIFQQGNGTNIELAFDHIAMQNLIDYLNDVLEGAIEFEATGNST